MSQFWRTHFTFNKYSQIAARALRNSLKEDLRVASEKRGMSGLRYQNWEGGKGSEQVWVTPPADAGKPKKSAAV